MKTKLTLLLVFFQINSFAQVPFSEIFEDKQDMADAYYGTFKYKGEPYSGKVVAFHSNGKIKTLRSFKDGKYEGLWTEWYENGTRKFQGNRVENKGDGITRWWYKNGQIKKQCTYFQDLEDGVIVNWHENGVLKQIRYFDKGSAFGGWSTFDEEGNILDEGNDDNKYYRSFFGKDIAPEGFEETSPSFTKDGSTMVFARYADWVKKVPYIAKKVNNKWVKEKLTFVDTLYNFAISPDGSRIIYSTFEEKNGQEIRKTFVTDKKNDNWSSPVEIKNLSAISAGYFQIMENGRLYFFARQPKNGIYYSKLNKKGNYDDPVWVSDELSLPNSDSFDAFINPNETKLIITQAYSQKKYPERGKIGMYYYTKVNGNWLRQKRIPLAYAWGAQVISDKLIFVRNGNIQYVKLKDLDIKW